MSEQTIPEDHEVECPICGGEGEHPACDDLEASDWNASFGIHE